MPKKKITLEDLAAMVAKGFEGVEERLDGVEERMATKADLEDLEEQLRAEFSTKLELHDVEERLATAIADVKREVQKVTLLAVDLRALEQRVLRLEHHLGKQKR